MTGVVPPPLPELTLHDHVLTWALPPGWSAVSSSAVGGGLVRPRWVLNATVDGSFARTDLAAWASEVAAGLGLEGPGCALLTAADVGQVEHAHEDGVSAWATVGVTRPTWPHDPRAVLSCHRRRQVDHRDTTDAHGHAPPHQHAPVDAHEHAPPPGTVNIVVAVPVPLTPSALVQALATVTEAKAQVLVRSGVPGTGTASDAVVVMCPDATVSGGPAAPQDGSGVPSAGAPFAGVPFAGVRSTWGRRVAHAVHDAVLAGLAARPWTGSEHGAGRVW